MQRRRLFGVSAAFLLGAGLAARAQNVAEPTHAQPELPRQQLVIISEGGARHVFEVEVAKTPEQQTTGLMFRKSVPANQGMLFIWGSPIESQMWMKNTLMPLDMVFIDAGGTIHRIAENTVPQSLAVISSHGKVVATLELQGGITARLGILVGDRVICSALGTTQ